MKIVFLRAIAALAVLALFMALETGCGVAGSSSIHSSTASSSSSLTVSVLPVAVTLQTGLQQQFTASVSGTSNVAMTWWVNGIQGGNSSVGTISNSGLYIAPSAVPTGAVTVTAQSVADTSKSASATVTVTTQPTPIAVSISPMQAALQAGLTQQFTASVSGTSNTGVIWTASGGTISSSGLYKAPSTSGNYTVKATSVADTTTSATATISVTTTAAAVSVTISPATATVAAGNTQQFSATVSGTTNTSVNWLVNGTAGGGSTVGTISSTGLYTAPACSSSAGVTVIAQSAYDSSKTADSSVTLTASSSSSTTDRYVSATGSDGNDGSACHPWATIQHAADMAKAGATVHVAAGTYTENNLTFNNSGTSSARIRFVSDTKWGAKIRVTSSYFVLVSNGNYVDIEGFDVAGASGTCVGINNAGSYSRVIGNLVHDIPAEASVCSSDGGAGIDASNYQGSDDDEIGNMVYHIGPWTVPNQNIQGIYHANLRGKVMNNIVFQVAAWAFAPITWPPTTSSAVTLCSTTEPAGSWWPPTAEPTTTLWSTTSIAINNGINGNVMAASGISERDSTGSHNSYSNNLVYHNYPNDISLQNGLVAAGTITADPQFVNYTGDASGDYHLKSTSPAINHGTSSNAPSIDFDGGVRPYNGSWDIGAYEWGAAPAAWPWM